MKIKDVMTPNVRTCFMSDSLATAAQLMWDHDCGCVPVLSEDARVVGMLTDRDICMAAYFQEMFVERNPGFLGHVETAYRLLFG